MRPTTSSCCNSSCRAGAITAVFATVLAAIAIAVAAVPVAIAAILSAVTTAGALGLGGVLQVAPGHVEADGVACDEPEGFMTFRLGLFGLRSVRGTQ